jgi:UDP-galactopyranose mutase
MMVPFTRHLKSECVVYDCMDELANFDFAPPELPGLERELLAMSDLVFTGGYSLYEAKREVHSSVHAFPSSVDTRHFATARGAVEAPADQQSLPGKRLGFFGVIDERIDLGLIAGLPTAIPTGRS